MMLAVERKNRILSILQEEKKVVVGELATLFDVSEETIKAIAKQKPYYFVMRDSSMASDSVATNFDQIFATYSPDTVRKVL